MSKEKLSPLFKKRVVVLGGTSGIGLATAIAAAEVGASVIVVSSNQARVDKALTLLNGDHKGFAVDLTEENQIKKLFLSLGKIDHLIFTAGESLSLGKITETSTEKAIRFFNLRYWGAYKSVKYAAPLINEGGSIVLTGGTAGARPGVGWSLGTSICAAMEGFTRAMAIELAPIRVNIVIPGIVKTDLWSSFSESDREKMYDQYSNLLPVKKVGNPSDIARTYIYLMEQPFSTGQSVIVDGGGVLV